MIIAIKYNCFCDTLTQAGGKTGERLNAAIIGPLRKLVDAAGAVKDFNDATGGNAGMIALLGAATIGTRLFVGGIRTAYQGVNRLNAALEALAGTSSAAASGVTRQSIANVGAAGGGLGSGLVGASKLVKGVGNVAGYGIAFGAEIIGGKMAQSENKTVAGAGGILQSAGLGAQIGMAIGSFIPVVGTAIGGLAGAVAGAAIDGGQRLWEAHEAKDDKASAADRTAKATEKTADAVEKMSVKLDGGGKSGREASSLLEREYSVYALVRGKSTGFA